ncbi:MAG: hypothetical protein K0R05_2770 [Anaerocolumna sp.]|jgi:hypothetical protein|nr:hypothetical protein [Anaerocolumna sp.]
MGLFNNLKEPVFLKENSNIDSQLENLRNLEPVLNEEGLLLLKQDIKSLEYGIAGEAHIAFELKNCHMPMYILHDVYLELGDLSAQIDYLVFTRKLCFVLECKNLYGNIEINNVGDFIRTTEFGGKKKKEGIYSPITQNQRHLELMKKIRVNSKNNILTKIMAEKYFEDINKSVVVLANPKTVLNAKFAQKEVKEKVIRADQLVKYIKDMYENSKELAMSDEKMLLWAQSYLDLHKDVDKDYSAKYEKYRIIPMIENTTEQALEIQKDNNADVISIHENAVSENDVSIEETKVYQELKAYRLNKSREERIKPYFIYNDSQLKDLILKMPKSREELLKVSGFGEAKVNKYGEDILKVIENYK